MLVQTLFPLFLAVAGAAPAPAALELAAGLDHPVLLAGRKNHAYLRVGLVGREAPVPERRPQVNLCLAIDRSGSMQGEKIVNARSGALLALDRLAPNDIISVVAYDDVVRVLVPATRASDRSALAEGIAGLQPGGDTALFAGVVKCAAEVRKFLDQDRVNRIVLLSDGIANVGPSSPAELGTLGAQLMAEGISVVTVGLGTGYNEELMSELAQRSDGGHVFVERAEDLGRFLDGEFASAKAIVATDLEVKVRCGSGVRPLRVIGRPADIVGQTVTAPFAKVYGRRQHYFVLEVEIDPSAAGTNNRRVAEVDVKYRDLLRNRTDTLGQTVLARFSPRPAEVEAAADRTIISELGFLQDDAAYARAFELIKVGDRQRAQEVLEQNARRLEEVARRTKDRRVTERVRRAREKAEEIESRPPAIMRKRIMEIKDDPLGGL